MSAGLLLSLAMLGVGVGIATFVLSRAAAAFWQRYKAAFTEQARFNLADMFLFIDADVLWRVNAVALVVLPALLWVAFANPLLVVVAAVVIGVAPRRAYAWLKRRRIDQIVAQLPDSLLMIAGSMRAGLGFAQALEGYARDAAPPMAQELALVLREQRMGVKLDDALGRFHQRVPEQEVALFVSAVAIAREVGGNLAESLDSLGESLRRRLLMEGKVKSLTAQGRLQGIVMALMPVGLVVFLSVAYPETMHRLYHTPPGWAVIALALVMEYLGYRMAARIATIDI